jgi:hypothetical protein
MPYSYHISNFHPSYHTGTIYLYDHTYILAIACLASDYVPLAQFVTWYTLGIADHMHTLRVCLYSYVLVHAN